MKSFNEWRKLRENSFGHDLGREASIDTGPDDQNSEENRLIRRNKKDYLYEFKCLDCEKKWWDETVNFHAQDALSNPNGPDEIPQCPTCASDNVNWIGKMELEEYRKKEHPQVNPKTWYNLFHYGQPHEPRS